jgi:G3E family GTPase
MTRLIFVGGFLGAGKTTLLYEVNKILNNRGITTGLITNDQAPDLVDTGFLGHSSPNVTEVSGSCFCCDFKALRRAYEKVGSNLKTDIVIAEPVGSCTDLSATLINPIKDMMKTEVTVSPLTVLVEPRRLKEIFEGTSKIHPSAEYIVKKQLEESDIIAITKSDLYSPVEIDSLSGKVKENFPDYEIMTLSARTGEGIEKWLDIVLNGKPSGIHIADIDYEIYAEGEAVLGWLNCSLSLTGKEIDWDSFIRRFMEDLSSEFDKKRIPVGHVKIIIENGDQYAAANLTGASDTLSFRWYAGSGDTAKMTVNARVEMKPDELEELVLKILSIHLNGNISMKINRLSSITPGYPKPTYRYKKI